MRQSFFDSNIPIYAVGDDLLKAEAAAAALVDGGWISTQVLNETTLACRRKLRFDWDRTQQVLNELIMVTRVADLTIETHRLGVDLARRHNFQIYDSMIVASALLAGCDILYSEDMQHGLVVDGRLTITNPFADL